MQLSPEDLKAFQPLIDAAVAKAIAAVRQEAGQQQPLVYTEAEAAAVLKLKHHALRDERRRGRIASSKGPRGVIRYTRQQLDNYLTSRPYVPNPGQ